MSSRLQQWVLAAAVALTGALPAWAQGEAEMAEAEVRRIDKAAGKITLRHGPIKNLDMPPMTMVFQVADASLLDQVKVGDQVRFAAVHEEGRYRVTALKPQPAK